MTTHPLDQARDIIDHAAPRVMRRHRIDQWRERHDTAIFLTKLVAALLTLGAALVGIVIAAAYIGTHLAR